jgi:hypothetical protein
MINDSIEITTDKQDLRAGQGNVLQMVYFHTSAMNITLEEQQFNLDMAGRAIGSSIVTGASIWEEETVTLTAGAGVVLGTPIATSSGNIYGWVTLTDGTVERVTFTGSNFTVVGQSTGEVYVRYYETNSAARQLTVNANIIPSVVRLVVEAQLFSGDPNNVSASSLVGKVLVEIPRAQLGGAVKFDMSSSGVSNTPINAMALANSVTGSGSGVYATITELIDSANWYDAVYALAIVDDTISVSTGTPTATLDIRAIPSVGDAFKPPYADLTFVSSDAAKATVSSSGVVTKVAAGTANITVTITNKNTIAATAIVTVS